MKKDTLRKPADSIIGRVYSLDGIMSFSIHRLGKEWAVSQHIAGLQDLRIRMMDGSRAGGLFPTFEEAEKELTRIFNLIQAPLTRKEIVHHFTLKWMRREEQGDLLQEFREALLARKWGRARELYNRKFSGFTKEAIPDKVVLQLLRH